MRLLLSYLGYAASSLTVIVCAIGFNGGQKISSLADFLSFDQNSHLLHCLRYIEIVHLSFAGFWNCVIWNQLE
ncbi:hypothetical protein AtNW77_Chr5g0129171 [Arabidopsis thaliana]|uniref:Transmembrane protein n=3 Tax=Arabidopsis TaxID=3701 RepID=B3H6U9_ARATH|nr:uncharacterized protein AT5G45469 [Arabidopsis thaliana]AED95255.1 transmembrane protein [Arabidopsis thaliana]KAG7605024.1 hypothetical protein ISN45_At05g040530 [Arabidopsis thaliana x Arabidopsis arenosa]CAA0407770.1 unnamed protein product [Arabidopsis thaliana]|eukprot:NP_001119379.1 transmembrane protein [Arabidopsis thaliana]